MIDSELSQISKYLTEEVVNEVFKKITNSPDSVKRVVVTRAAPAGEGLLSVVYRIHAIGHQHSTSFIVKGLVTDLQLRKTLDCTKYFKREVDFFSKILPVLIEIQTSLGAKERIQNHIPVCYGCHHDGENDYILLEDLAKSGCHSVNETPTFDQKNNVIKTLAHFHAVSIALRLKRPEVFTATASSLSELYYNEENRDWYSTYLRNAVDIDRKVIDELEDADSIYSKKFYEVLSNDVYGQCISPISTWGDHPVICHGDAWAPNFMFSKDRTVVIDFQLLRCASPATDLAYWIIMCTNHSTVKRDFLDAVQTYYSLLEYYLKDMGLEATKVFSKQDLDRELKLYGKFGFVASLTSIPLMTSDKCDTLNEKFPNAERIPLESLWRLSPLQTEEHKLRLVNAVRVAVDVGLV